MTTKLQPSPDGYTLTIPRAMAEQAGLDVTTPLDLRRVNASLHIDPAQKD